MTEKEKSYVGRPVTSRATPNWWRIATSPYKNYTHTTISIRWSAKRAGPPSAICYGRGGRLDCADGA